MSNLSGDALRVDAEAGVQDPMHPLAILFADLARRVYPPVDGITEAMPRAAGAAAAVLSFTGHCVVAAIQAGDGSTKVRELNEAVERLVKA